MPLMSIFPSDATYVSADNQMNNYCNSDTLTVGNNKPNFNSHIILLKFKKPEYLNKRDIKRATIWIYVSKSSVLNSNQNSHIFVLYSNLTDFDEGSVDWCNRPSISNIPLGTVKIKKSDIGSYISCDITAIVLKLLYNIF